MRTTTAEEVVVGVDFGTLSGRAVVVRAADGEVLGCAVTEYPHAVLDRALPSGRQLPRDWALQVPDDYRAVLRTAIGSALRASQVDLRQVVAIGTDFTASTVLPVQQDGTPLAEVPRFVDDPHAYVKLWKHHAAQAEADDVNRVAREMGEPWLARYGGLVSSEWMLPKALQVLREAPEVHAAADLWVEAGDWVVWQLCGELVRGEGAAGYKGLRQDGQYPSRTFLRALEAGLEDFTTRQLAGPVLALGSCAGRLTAAAADMTGLPEGIPVAVGNIDAHVAAPSARTTRPGEALVIMGTSTCHLVNGTEPVEVPGMSGAVDGGIAPGLWGYEAGQSGAGDILAWLTSEAVPARYEREAAARGTDVHGLLSDLAATQEVGAHGLLALDWWNGNRSVLVDHHLSGMVMGLTLSTRAEDVYRAVVEAIAFGTRRIMDAFQQAGISVDDVVAAGGMLRNPFVMQVQADVLGRPLSTVESEHGAAVGAAIHGAVAAERYEDIHAAAEAMGRRGRRVYEPRQSVIRAYDDMYREYLELHDHFGVERRDLMHNLRIRATRNDSRDRPV